MKSLSFYCLKVYLHSAHLCPRPQSTYHWPKKVPQDLKLLHATTVGTISRRWEGGHRKERKMMCRKSTFPRDYSLFSNSACVGCSHAGRDNPPQCFQTPSQSNNTHPQQHATLSLRRSTSGCELHQFSSWLQAMKSVATPWSGEETGRKQLFFHTSFTTLQGDGTWEKMPPWRASFSEYLLQPKFQPVAQLWGLRQDPAKPLLLRGWWKQWITQLSQRRSRVNKAPAKKKHAPAPRNISEI